jgi:hypothetical protein
MKISASNNESNNMAEEMTIWKYHERKSVKSSNNNEKKSIINEMKAKISNNNKAK